MSEKKRAGESLARLQAMRREIERQLAAAKAAEAADLAEAVGQEEAEKLPSVPAATAQQ